MNSRRHPRAEEPAAGQESVWDYPRPPALVPSDRRVVVRALPAGGGTAGAPAGGGTDGTPAGGGTAGASSADGTSPGGAPQGWPDADGAVLVADTRRAFRVLETSHPPTWYLPREDVAPGLLRRSAAPSTTCEFKGAATYWDLDLPDGRVLRAAAWSYEDPTPGFAAIAGHVSVRPGVLECSVDGEVARPQEGQFYAGWITDDVVGPFKGAPGTWGW